MKKDSNLTTNSAHLKSVPNISLQSLVHSALAQIPNTKARTKRQSSIRNYDAWGLWIRSRTDLELADCADGRELNREIIASGCGLTQMALSLNPNILREILAIEQEFRAYGYLKPAAPTIPSGMPSSDGPYNLISQIGRIDPTFAALIADNPTMEHWRSLTHRYLSHVSYDLENNRFKDDNEADRPRLVRVVISYIIKNLSVFLVDYLQSPEHPNRRNYVINPETFFRKDSGPADEFWHEHCLPLVDARRTKPGSKQSHRAQSLSTDVTDFLGWVLRTDYSGSFQNTSEGASVYHCPFRARTSSGVLREKRLPKDVDLDLGWVRDECPHLEEWRVRASQWMRQQKRNVGTKLSALSKFIGSYLVDAQMIHPAHALAPQIFLLKTSNVPDNFASLFTSSTRSHHDTIVGFLDWILLHECSDVTNEGEVNLSPAYRNPFRRLGGDAQAVQPAESVRAPLPYGYIDELRRILVEGPHFKDWSWAQRAMSSKQKKGFGPDWFKVDKSQIDPNDPNCVWRERAVGKDDNKTIILEMWSPVRWVALLTKLIVALRLMQVRVLDSGEADTYSYTGQNSVLSNDSVWTLNEKNGKLREQVFLSTLGGKAIRFSAPTRGSKADKVPLHNRGVLRRKSESIRSPDGHLVTKESVELYVNSNKTADHNKIGTAKGYSIPWPVLSWPLLSDGTVPMFETHAQRSRWLGELSRNVHYWLQQMRDWQTKYNPISTLTSWKELVTNALITAQSDEALEHFPDTAFLFREPAWRGGENKTSTGRPKADLPVTTGMMNKAWWYLLKELQDRLAERGHTAPDGSPVVLVRELDDDDRGTFFPLHALRVSLITALALEGGMPLHLLQKVVGHSRLLMTLYYVKPSQSDIEDGLRQAEERLTTSPDESINKWLRSQNVDRLRDEAAYNDAESAFSALGLEVADRNPAGWMTLFNGVCPVGGNTDPTPENTQIGGCHNGGGLITTTGGGARNRRYGPVPGGSRNCVRCRWFITEARYIPALVAQFNNLSFRYSEAQEEAISKLEELESLKDEEWDLEQDGADAQAKEVHRRIQIAQRQHEATVKSLSDTAETMVACHRLIMRCMAVLEARDTSEDSAAPTALIANGGNLELKVVMETTDSELLQLSGVSFDAEIYTDLDPGKAVLRQSQLLDKALVRDGLRPHFLSLTEKQQHLLGNEFVRRLSEMFDSADTKNGRHMAITALEQSDLTLSQLLGCSKGDIQALATLTDKPKRVIPIKAMDANIKLEIAS